MKILHGFTPAVLEELTMYLFNLTQPLFGQTLLKILLTDDRSQSKNKDVVSDFSAFYRRIYKGISVLDAKEIFQFLLQLLKEQLDTGEFYKLANPFFEEDPYNKGVYYINSQDIIANLKDHVNDIFGGMNIDNLISLLSILYKIYQRN